MDLQDEEQLRNGRPYLRMWFEVFQPANILQIVDLSCQLTGFHLLTELLIPVQYPINHIYTAYIWKVDINIVQTSHYHICFGKEVSVLSLGALCITHIITIIIIAPGRYSEIGTV